MQEQQEGAIMSCISRVNELTMAVDVMRATVHNMGKVVDGLTSQPVRTMSQVTTHDEPLGVIQPEVFARITPGPDGDSRPLEAE